MASNYQSLAVICSPAEYQGFLQALSHTTNFVFQIEFVKG